MSNILSICERGTIAARWNEARENIASRLQCMADAAIDAGPCHAGHSPARVNSIPISYSTDSLLSKAASTARLEAAAARSPATLKRRLDSEGTFAYARRRCVCSLSRLPVQASAIALNVASISGMLDLLVKAKGSRQRFLLPLSNMLCVEATLLVGLYLLRALCSRDLMRELSSRTVVSSHSVCLTTVQVLLSSPGSTRQMGGALASGLAAMVAHASGALNLCLTCRFLYLYCCLAVVAGVSDVAVVSVTSMPISQ